MHLRLAAILAILVVPATVGCEVVAGIQERSEGPATTSSSGSTSGDCFTDETYRTPFTLTTDLQRRYVFAELPNDCILTWNFAQQLCYAEGAGADLAAFSQSQELQDVLGSIAVNHGAPYSFWVGGTDADEEGVWEWTNGEAWNDDLWVDGQPDDGGDGPGGDIEENCAVLDTDNGNKLDDLPCAGLRSAFLCEGPALLD